MLRIRGRLRRVSTTAMLALAMAGAAIDATAQVWSAPMGTTFVSLEARPQGRASPDPLVARFEVSGQAPVEVPLGQGVVRSVKTWNGQRVVVLLDRDVSVLDVNRREQSDRFFADDVQVSPDGRYIAYRRVVPAFENDNAVYLVYDVSQPPRANRMAVQNGFFVGRQDVGVAVYPRSNQAARTYDPTFDGHTHHLSSQITWLDSSRFAFVDFEWPAGREATCYAVAVSLSQGVSNAVSKSTALDTAAIVDGAKVDSDLPPAGQIKAKEIQVLRVTPTSEAIRLVFEGYDTVKVPSVDIVF